MDLLLAIAVPSGPRRGGDEKDQEGADGPLSGRAGFRDFTHFYYN